MSACEAFVDNPAVTDGLRRDWACVFAMQAMWVRDSRAIELARQSIALSRAAGDEWNLLLSLVAIVRSKDCVDDELEAAVLELGQLNDAHPQWLIRVRSLALGAFAWAARVRGDYTTCLDLRQKVVDIAVSKDSARLVDLANSELAEALWLVGCTSEAVQRLRALLVSSRGIDDAIVATTHVRRGRILFDTGRLDEARVEWPALANRSRRFGVEAAELAVFAAAKSGHPRSAALLLGHVRAIHARRGSAVSSLPTGDIARATTLMLQSLDRETLDQLIGRSRELTEAEADELLLAGEDD